MKKGRISKQEEAYILENINLDHNFISGELGRDAGSVLKFIKKKVAGGDFPVPTWLEEFTREEQASYDLSQRPYWKELESQFTSNEMELFVYHWTRVIGQFKDDVIPTEEIQVVDLIKLELLMNRCLKNNKQNIEQVETYEELIRELRAVDTDQQDRDEIFNLERQVTSLRASQEALNKDYRELQTKKNSMLKEMKATREQRVKRYEDSKSSFTGWLGYLVANPEVAENYGLEMEKMRMASEKEKDRLSKLHKYEDGLVDRPILTPDTVFFDDN